jgi:hypothetical protein
MDNHHRQPSKSPVQIVAAGRTVWRSAGLAAAAKPIEQSLKSVGKGREEGPIILRVI